jgi:hypothetical protein
MKFNLLAFLVNPMALCEKLEGKLIQAEADGKES